MDTEKYIRTFAGDMAIVKQGGMPDLAPLTEQTSSPPLRETLREGTAAERLVAASPIAPRPAPEPEPQPAQKEAPPFVSPLATPIKTYASDFSDQMKKEQASPMTVLAAEQDAGAQPGSQAASPSRSGVLYVLAGVVLCVIGGLAAYFAYTRSATSPVPVALEPGAPTPILVDEREEIAGVGVVLQQAIEQSAGRLIASGAVRLLSHKDAAAGDTVFAALQLPAPNILLRNVNVKGTMAGIVHVRGSQSPFFILSVASYRDTFSGMLSWEPTMQRDLEALFPAYPVATTTTATSTSAQAAGFRDEVVSNHDIRAYRDAARRAVVVYGYWDQTTLIIARDSAAFAEILDRLASSRVR